jgi:peptidoglycan hydrolase-like protein with peptidoglycan-binding domain
LTVKVQRILKRLGYYRGPIDGDFGPGTSAAVRAYQVDNQLPPTGRIDRFLLRSLGL